MDIRYHLVTYTENKLFVQ